MIEHQGDALSITNMVTPYHLAKKEGIVDVASFLVDQGADADAARCGTGQRKLHPITVRAREMRYNFHGASMMVFIEDVTSIYEALMPYKIRKLLEHCATT